ncbi:MAG: flagellar export chaperone FliS [Bdellovibrionales bacterium]|nr:flagellar export chaperone FliS [Bdellovibrionales bacterium]
MSYNKYKQTAVESANREKLLLMLYEGAIRFTKRAVIATENGNIPERCENIGKAYDIVLELMNTLDFKVGGEVAENLEQLYMFITDELTRANLTGKSEHLQNVLKILETLYDGWKEAVEILKKKDSKGA